MNLLENAYIYCFKNNDKIIYIGKSHQPIENRLEQHLKNCHNKKLKEYIESDTPPVFEVIYESHNEITEEILSSIEKSYIETLKPECNIEGVTIPYGYMKSKNTIKQKELGWADILNKKKTLSDQDIEIILKQNPQIINYRLINIEEEVEELKNSYLTDVNQISNETIKKALYNELELRFNKLNNFNEKKFFNPVNGDFQQKVWVVRNKETKEKRFLTNEEKMKGFKKNDQEELVQCRILYYCASEEEMLDQLEGLKSLESKYFKMDNLEAAWDISEVIYGIIQMLKQENYFSLYFPLKIIQIKDFKDEQKYNLGYLNTLTEWIFKLDEEKRVKSKEEKNLK